MSISTNEPNPMSNMTQLVYRQVVDTWTTTDFGREEMSRFARKLTVDDTRSGLRMLSALLLVLFVGAWFLFQHLGLEQQATYTCLLLAALTIHIFVSARVVGETEALHLLGTTLLMISGAAFVILANTAGTYDLSMFATVTLLFMAVPVIPWGLREATRVLLMIYIMFTVSTVLSPQGLDASTLWSLQFVMLGSGAISITMVIANTAVRKTNIRRHFELEAANRRMAHLSNKDPLTNAWNRRFLEQTFNDATVRWQEAGLAYHFVFLDVDDFKTVNDIYGHEAGDLSLCNIALVYELLLKDCGYVIRMGGDEFALLFHSDHPVDLLIEGLHRIKSQCVVDQMGGDAISLSFGMASVQAGQGISQAHVYRSADQMLAIAKSRKHKMAGELNVERVHLKAEGPSDAG